jgi:tungstate transport system substrate-binding protein
MMVAAWLAGSGLLSACGASAPPNAAPGPTPTPTAAASTAGTASATLRSMSQIPRAAAGKEEVILATTTSTQDSGLLDVLIPMFEKQTGYQVKPIAVGTGQSLALGARGEADVVLVHAPDSEKTWMAEGNGTARLLVMHNDYVVVGPADDPAKAKGAAAADALKRIAQAGAPFISRGDNSGTHQAELAIWKAAGVEAKGQAWYQESGQGMGATLNIANEKGGYTLTDRSTFLARRATLQLAILVEGSKELLNVYHVMPVNQQKFPTVNVAGGQAFADFMVSREAQEAVKSYGMDRYGQPLFFADAGKRDEEVGG